MRPVLIHALLLAACSPGAPPPPEAPPEPPRLVAFAPDAGDAAVPPALRGFCQGERAGGPVKKTYAPRDYRWTRPLPALAWSGYAQGGTRFRVPLRCVVRTPAEWAAVRAYGGLPDRALRPVDFASHLVIVATQGALPGGYVAVDSLYFRGDTVTAVILQSRTSRPPPGRGISTVPLSLVQVPRRAAAVEFVERARRR
ncbi:MAG TPA: hypothetical protein VK420_01340 [Longimicrobium sp.]|nr:hypothetical protein [Longimicrobium sp.]